MRVIAMTAMLFISMLVFIAGGTQVHAQPIKQATQSKQKHQTQKVVIKPGDTLLKIAKKHKTTYLRIFYANDSIKDPDLIFSGQKVRIPAKGEKLSPRPIGEAETQTAVEPKHKRSVHKKVSAHKAKHVAKPHKRHVAITYARSGGGVWDRIAKCESGGNWSTSTGNGYYGGLQFTVSSWRAVGGKGMPNHASKSEQIARAKILQSRQGWGAWPACTAKLGIR